MIKSAIIKKGALTLVTAFEGTVIN
jgi:hypothetical protein